MDSFLWNWTSRFSKMLCWKDNGCSIVLHLLLSQKSIGYIYVLLFPGVYSIPLIYLSFLSTAQHHFDYCKVNLEVKYWQPLFFSIALTILVLLSLYIDIRISLSICRKYFPGFMTRISLNLQINLRRTEILILLRVSIH
jgi:hypothetical protein